MSEQGWKNYIEQAGNEPRELLVKALDLIEARGEALDLGAGSLRDSRFLLSRGFTHVTAVDKTAVRDEILAEFPPENFSYHVSKFGEFDFKKNTYDLVNAQYSLHLIPSRIFSRVFASILGSIKPGGFFVGQLLGERDEWNDTESDWTFKTKEEIEILFSNFKIIDLEEKEYTDKTASGNSKKWHQFNIIVQKM
jgi:SAM-dependent methyltransferase